MKQLSDLEECPYHRIKPWQLGPSLELPWLPDNWKNRKADLFWVLSRFFPDAILFEHEYTVFCPECAKKSPTPGKHNKFGCGFCSQHSLQEAKRNWNKAVCRFARRAIRDVLNGKDVSIS